MLGLPSSAAFDARATESGNVVDPLPGLTRTPVPERRCECVAPLPSSMDIVQALLHWEFMVTVFGDPALSTWADRATLIEALLETTVNEAWRSALS